MGRRLGLIVGVNQYQDAIFQPLRYAENDARALAQWLVNMKGGNWSPSEVQHVQGQHATKELIESLLRQVCIVMAEPGDLVLIYFAGHVYLDEHSGDGYLALANTNFHNPATGLHLPSFVYHALSRSQAGHILCIFDCYQTGHLWSARRSFPYDSQPLVSSALGHGLAGNRLFVCSCRGNELSPEGGERGLGLFMYNTIVGLSGPARDGQTGQTTLQSLLSTLSTRLDEQHRPQVFGRELTPLILIGEAPEASLPQSPVLNAHVPFSSPSPATPQDHTNRLAPERDGPAIATAQPPMQQQRSPTGPFGSPVAEQQRLQQSQALLQQAQQYAQAQRLPEALQLVEQALQAAPGNLVALTLKGQLLGTMGRLQEAFPVVEQLIQRDPNNALAWSMRAVLLSQSGRPQEALEAIDRSLALAPNNPEAQAIKHSLMSTASVPDAEKNKSSMVQPVRQRDRAVSFLLGASAHVLGFVLGVAAAALLLFAHVPFLLPIGLLSIGLAILCVNAAWGTYVHGIAHVIPIVILSLSDLALLGATYKLGYTRLIGILGRHPTLMVPVIFLLAWFAVAALLPLLLAIGGLLTGVLRRKR